MEKKADAEPPGRVLQRQPITKLEDGMVTVIGGGQGGGKTAGLKILAEHAGKEGFDYKAQKAITLSAEYFDKIKKKTEDGRVMLDFSEEDKKFLADLIKTNFDRWVAIRSDMDCEDRVESAAGIFKTRFFDACALDNVDYLENEAREKLERIGRGHEYEPGQIEPAIVDELMSRLQVVWGSWQDEDAQEYFSVNGIKDARMSVILQNVDYPEIGGVADTVYKDKVVFRYNDGVGFASVEAGEVCEVAHSKTEPFEYELETRVTSKTRVQITVSGYAMGNPEFYDDGDTEKLNNFVDSGLSKKITQIALNFEKELGYPVDIEFSVSGDARKPETWRLSLIQIRESKRFPPPPEFPEIEPQNRIYARTWEEEEIIGTGVKPVKHVVVLNYVPLTREDAEQLLSLVSEINKDARWKGYLLMASWGKITQKGSRGTEIMLRYRHISRASGVFEMLNNHALSSGIDHIARILKDRNIFYWNVADIEKRERLVGAAEKGKLVHKAEKYRVYEVDWTVMFDQQNKKTMVYKN